MAVSDTGLSICWRSYKHHKYSLFLGGFHIEKHYLHRKSMTFTLPQITLETMKEL